MKKNLFHPKKLLPEFDNFLHQKGIKFEAVVIAHPSWGKHVDSRVQEFFKDLAYESK